MPNQTPSGIPLSGSTRPADVRPWLDDLVHKTGFVVAQKRKLCTKPAGERLMGGRWAAEIKAAAIQEDVVVVGLSILSGAHASLTRKTVEALRAAGAGDVLVVVGGTIPAGDVQAPREAGAAVVYPAGSTLPDIVESMRSLTA